MAICVRSPFHSITGSWTAFLTALVAAQLIAFGAGADLNGGKSPSKPGGQALQSRAIEATDVVQLAEK